MNEAAKSDPDIQARVNLFRYRVPEELYDLTSDSDNLHNLIGEPAYRVELKQLQDRLVEHMRQTNDPMLHAFLNRDDRAKVDNIMLSTYGPKKNEQKRDKKEKTTNKSK